MHVLLLDAHPMVDDAPASVTASAVDALERGGHTVDRCHLPTSGFDRFMSAEERHAYHEDDNLVTPEQRDAVARLRRSSALLVCCPMRHGAVPPVVKSWFERVLIPGVSFTFTRSGRITGALTNIRRAGMVITCDNDDAEPHRRASSGRSLLRGLRLNSHKLCRTSYVPIRPGDGADALITAELSGW